MEAALAHPVFDPLRPWLDRLGEPGAATLEGLNALAEASGVRVASGKLLRFVPPADSERNYELRIHESGCVATRAGNRHDLFNALAWLAFPKTKAQLNARHAAEIPREHGHRGRFRDLLTLFDEGGAIVRCDDPALVALVRGFRWKELFWDHRARLLQSMQIAVLGHAVLEKALEPWPGIACKALFVGAARSEDDLAAEWLESLPPTATPQELAPLPIFGYPGWSPGNDRREFYDDTRYFRPFKRDAVRA